MSKVAIIGVEGSGKTVLMAAIGKYFQSPDVDGYFLQTKTQDTLELVESTNDLFWEGKWPDATAPEDITRLDWKLWRKQASKLKEVCDISFLDYGGEIYRVAFSEKSEYVLRRNLFKEQIESLKNHIISADVLLVLVNLREVINHTAKKKDMLWVTQAIFKYVHEYCPKMQMALAYSQYESYRIIAENMGGLNVVLQKFLPTLANLYPKIKLLTFTAVKNIKVDADGKEIPAPGEEIKSEGILELRQWITGVLEGINRRNFIRKTLLGCLAVGSVTCGIGAVVEGVKTGLEKIENERQAKLEKERLDRERQAKLEEEKLEKERLEKEKQAKLEEERLEKERLEKERLERERVQIWDRELKLVNKKEIILPLPNGAKMEMVWCPSGTFEMGSSWWPWGRDSDETLHKVTLTKGFWIGKFEVTQAQWNSVMGSNSSYFMGANLPVGNVSWDECQQFCKKLGQWARLPTEAEWEYACRAGSSGKYGGTGELDDMGWYSGNSREKTHPVGQKKPNAWGIYDMHGNVCEWCFDWYSEYSGDAVDPTGPASGSHRVLRGGSWYDNAHNCRSAYRGNYDPSNYHSSFGFRLCCGSAGLQ